MSFAEEFGHDIPSDDEFIYGGGSYSYRTRDPNLGEDANTHRIIGQFYESIIHETPKATLFEFKRGDAWIPKSRIHSIKKDIKKVYIPFWLYINLKYI